jgi:hypothetical protein
MDVQVIIISNSDGNCQVAVSASESTRNWIKRYQDKTMCLNELISVGLITHIEMAEEQASNLANRNRMFMIQTAIVGEAVLRAAGFVEQKKEYVMKSLRTKRDQVRDIASRSRTEPSFLTLLRGSSQTMYMVQAKLSIQRNSNGVTRLGIIGPGLKPLSMNCT